MENQIEVSLNSKSIDEAIEKVEHLIEILFKAQKMIDSFPGEEKFYEWIAMNGAESCKKQIDAAVLSMQHSQKMRNEACNMPVYFNTVCPICKNVVQGAGVNCPRYRGVICMSHCYDKCPHLEDRISTTHCNYTVNSVQKGKIL